MKFRYLLFALLLFDVSCKKEDKKENQPPVIQIINCSPNARKAGAVYILTVLATDPDGDTLQYLWTAEEGEFTGPVNSPETKWQSPQNGQGKTFAISVIVSDGKVTVDKTVQIKLNENNAPVISKITTTPESAKAGTIFSLKAEASDTDSDSLVYKWTADDGEFPDGNDKDVVNWKSPLGNVDKKYSIKVAVSDDFSTISQTLEITVIKNSAPVITMITSAPESAEAGTVFTLKVEASDPDNDPLTYNWTCDEGGFPDGDDLDIVLWRSPMSSIDKDYRVRVSISDGVASDNKTLDIKVIKNRFNLFTDSRDGHEYKSLVIGTQTWMAENLAYLPAVSPPSSGSEYSVYYYVYDYIGTSVNIAKTKPNYASYGVLYNWLAAKSACPLGWHLPNEEEWNVLEGYLGMSQEDVDGYGWRESGSVGKALKSTSGWIENGNGDNSSGFSALPVGLRDHDGGFHDLGITAHFWSASDFTSSENSSGSWYRILSYDNEGIWRYNTFSEYGFSVRCLKN